MTITDTRPGQAPPTADVNFWDTRYAVAVLAGALISAFAGVRVDPSGVQHVGLIGGALTAALLLLVTCEFLDRRR